MKQLTVTEQSFIQSLLKKKIRENEKAWLTLRDDEKFVKEFLTAETMFARNLRRKINDLDISF